MTEQKTIEIKFNLDKVKDFIEISRGKSFDEKKKNYLKSYEDFFNECYEKFKNEVEKKL